MSTNSGYSFEKKEEKEQDEGTGDHQEHDTKEEESSIKISADPKTLEEDEEVLLKLRAKLFRFDKSAVEWRERGTGEMKILKHKQSTKIRVLMRRDKTFKICANHYIAPIMKLKEAVGNDKSWIWTAMDFAEEEPKEEKFLLFVSQLLKMHSYSRKHLKNHKNKWLKLLDLLILHLIIQHLFLLQQRVINLKKRKKLLQQQQQQQHQHQHQHQHQQQQHHKHHKVTTIIIIITTTTIIIITLLNLILKKRNE